MVALVVTMLMAVIMADSFLGGPSTTFVTQRRTPVPKFLFRGGATTASDQDDIEFESSEDEAVEEESEDESEDEAVEAESLDPKLAKAAQAKATSVKTKLAKVAVQAAVAASIKPKAKKSSRSLLKLLHVPYIIRACMNPFTLIKMTRAYFGSLAQLDYLNDNDSSKDLRSALQEKAKKGGGSGGSSRGKRKFKPGKAKVSPGSKKNCLHSIIDLVHPSHSLTCSFSWLARLCRICLSSIPEVKKGISLAGNELVFPVFPPLEVFLAC